MFGLDDHDDKDDSKQESVVQPEDTSGGTKTADDNDDQSTSDDAKTNDSPDTAETRPPLDNEKQEDDPTDLDVADKKDSDDQKPTPPPRSSNPDSLLEIKRSALQELSPLLDQLTLRPEEKFRTTMMMIQAFDDQKLIAGAYEAAKKISNEKERAEALLDIVNEVNYFTQGTNEQDK